MNKTQHNTSPVVFLNSNHTSYSHDAIVNQQPRRPGETANSSLAKTMHLGKTGKRVEIQRKMSYSIYNPAKRINITPNSDIQMQMDENRHIICQVVHVILFLVK